MKTPNGLQHAKNDTTTDGTENRQKYPEVKKGQKKRKEAPSKVDKREKKITEERTNVFGKTTGAEGVKRRKEGQTEWGGHWGCCNWEGGMKKCNLKQRKINANWHVGAGIQRTTRQDDPWRRKGRKLDIVNSSGPISLIITPNSNKSIPAHKNLQLPLRLEQGKAIASPLSPVSLKKLAAGQRIAGKNPQEEKRGGQQKWERDKQKQKKKKSRLENKAR